ncbi:MAG TPA: CocE/NonD family hydrolase [Vicinamibacterales bacterium]|nr:CocE/NonD family hydrolase [Vicinamibacterales bacterium]
MRFTRALTPLPLIAGLVIVVSAQQPAAPAPPNPVRAGYTKYEHMIPMRDGVRLFTSVYVPKTCTEPSPIVMQRTPYSVAPYGIDNYRTTIGPSDHFLKEGVIAVYQDVRGRYLSEGEWVEVRPYNPAKGPKDTDESTDTWDTVEWLVKNVSCNNGRVGMWGISYPGFYVSVGMIGAHPALKAVSPQAPVTDYYLGDDSFHNGAFMLAANFGFYTNFLPRLKPERPQERPRFDYGTPSGYEFYLQMGSLWTGAEHYGLLENPYYRGNLEHTSYDEFWKARSLWRHFKGITPAVLAVGGWFDAEDLAGPLRTYATLRADSPATESHLVMGPWTHGSWARGDGRTVGNLDFGQDASAWYREQVEFPFFMQHLTDKAVEPVAAATVFETGTNRWRTFDTWPPAGARETMYLGAAGTLSASAPAETDAFDQYVSDPNRPVPYVGHVQMGMQRDYMTEDQRFATTRPDVLVYQTPALDEDLTVLGPIAVDLYVSTSGTDSDFVVKVIDVYPGDYPTPEWTGPVPEPANRVRMGGYQQLVRGEPYRGKFRNGFDKPAPFAPGQPDRIRFDLPDVAHTFRRGHRLMVQIQSSWFPLTDRNPQVFTDIPRASPEDFKPATQRVYRSRMRASALTLNAERHQSP